MRINKKYFEEGWKSWKKEIKEYKYFILVSLIVAGIATYVDYIAGVYTSSANVVSVPDLILDNIGPYDLGFLFIYGYLALTFLLFFYPIFFHIGKLHKVVGQFSLLIVIRSFFIIFTHLQTPLDVIHAVFPWPLTGLYFANDLFFSGHVAVPFLGFLLYKDSWMKYLFLLGSIIMGITVLLMHQHYSIDVFAAFFITYGSYKIGNFLFKRIKPDF